MCIKFRYEVTDVELDKGLTFQYQWVPLDAMPILLMNQDKCISLIKW